MTTNIWELIPNWLRFVELYHPSEELIEAFTERIDSIDDADIRWDIAKYINLELGILILSHREIDEKKIREMLALTRSETPEHWTPS